MVKPKYQKLENEQDSNSIYKQDIKSKDEKTHLIDDQDSCSIDKQDIESIYNKISKYIKEAFPNKHYITTSQIPDLVDDHLKSIQALFELDQTMLANCRTGIKTAFTLNVFSPGLKYLFEREFKKALGAEINVNHIDDEKLEELSALATIVQFFSKEDRENLNRILKQYGEDIKERDFKIVSVFEAIKLFFVELFAKFKTKSPKERGFTTVIVSDWKQEGKSRFSNLHDRFDPNKKVETTSAESQAVTSTLETIPEEDENLSVESDRVSTESYITVEDEKQFAHNEAIDTNPQIAQIESLPKAQTAHKTENNSTKSAVPPKPCLDTTCRQKNQGYGKNVAKLVKDFEMLNSDIKPQPKVKGNVEALREIFEPKSQNMRGR